MHLLSCIRSSQTMSQASSSAAASKDARFRRARALAHCAAPPLLDSVPPHPLAVAQQPLVVVPPAEIDGVTGLPLIWCPNCKDVRLIALTVNNSIKNLSKRFFKCPRKIQNVPGTCSSYWFEDYVVYVKSKGFLGPAQPSLLEAIPELLDGIDKVQFGIDELKEQMEVMKNREPRTNICGVLMCINLVLVSLAILLVVLK